MEPSASPPTDDAPHDTDGPPIQCEACRSKLDGAGRQGISYMLLDGSVTPVVSCETHLDRFTTVCGFTTDGTASALSHRPAGGLRCPGCQLASYEPGYPLIPVDGGAVAILACPTHQSEVVERFRTGLRTQQQLSADLGSVPLE